MVRLEKIKLANQPDREICLLNIQDLWHLPAMANEKELREAATRHKGSLGDLDKAYADAQTNELLVAEPPSAERLRDLLASLR